MYVCLCVWLENVINSCQVRSGKTWTVILGTASPPPNSYQKWGVGPGKRVLKPVPLCPTLTSLLAIHYCRVVVIASSSKQTGCLMLHSMSWGVHVASPYRSVYLWVRSMGAKSSKWCHQANWRLIKACWSAPIKLSPTSSFQTLSHSLYTYLCAYIGNIPQETNSARAPYYRGCHTVKTEVTYKQNR